MKAPGMEAPGMTESPTQTGVGSPEVVNKPE